jgi:hypothetical protein
VEKTMLCQLCRCDEAYNFHHFIPATLRSNKWFKKRYTKEEMRSGIDVCRQCHEAIHRLIPDEKDLGRKYHVLENLLSHPGLANYLEWKRKRARRSPSGNR